TRSWRTCPARRCWSWPRDWRRSEPPLPRTRRLRACSGRTCRRPRPRPPRTWPPGWRSPLRFWSTGGVNLPMSPHAQKGPRQAPTRGPAMNTDRLARHYATLTPAERLPLIMAASARGDEAEYEHLARSAPRVYLQAPDTFYLAEALLLATSLHMMELL